MRWLHRETLPYGKFRGAVIFCRTKRDANDSRRIHVLNQFWVVVLESKKTALSVWTDLPQTLTYLMAHPQPEQPSFGMVTNGDDILFVKLVQTDSRLYALSRVFAPFTSDRELYNALQILKRIGQVIGEGMG